MIGSVFRGISRPAESLVDKIPYESTLELRIFPDEVPIFLESTHGVAHGMSIFAEDKRSFML